MKNISRNLWLKLAAFILCSIMIVGLGITGIVAILTSNYKDVDGIGSTLYENIAWRYSRLAVQDYLDGDETAFSDLCDDTNMRVAVVKSKETSEDKVEVSKSEDQIYSSKSTISNPDYIFMINADNSRIYPNNNLWDAISYSDNMYSDDEDNTEDVYIETMAYSVESGLFYAYLDNDETYIIPKVRIYRDTDNGTTSEVYILAKKTDNDGQDYYEYDNVFSGDALQKDGYKDWYEVDCYDNIDNKVSYIVSPDDAFTNESSDEIYISNQIVGDYKVLPESYTVEDDGCYMRIPIEGDSPEYYWVYVKMPMGDLADKGDYFNQLDSYLQIMSFIEKNMTLLFMIFIIGFIATAGYLFAFAGKHEGTEEVKLRLYDRIPYGIVFGVTWFADFALMFGCYVMTKQIAIVAMLVLIAAMISLELILTTFVRLRAHKFWRYTICYYIVRFFGRPIKKVCKAVVSPLKYGFSKIADNPPLFLVGCVAFGVICFLELIGFMAGSIGFLFFIKLIEFALLMTFIMQYDRIRKAAKAIANGDFSKPIDISKLLLFFKQHGNDLNNVSNGIEAAVSEKMKSERFRTELITNVSHDIKTPLTSIINYVDLLQKEDIDNANVQEYLEVLNRQSARLKKLIEDLMEASKASTGSIKVELEELDAAVMLSQIAGEYQEKFQKKNLDLMIKNDVSPVMIKADGRHLWRVFDNLMNNINKYAQPGTRVYVDIIPKDTGAIITFKNISECPLNISSEELMERFVRGDSSRNTEGSGLGLSIAESLMKLMNGTMKLSVDGDLFKVTLEF
ncbi:sensor histidine kinase [Agathobacter sp.]